MSLNFFFPEKSPAADVDNAESPRGQPAKSGTTWQLRRSILVSSHGREREDKLGFEGEKREGKRVRKESDDHLFLSEADKRGAVAVIASKEINIEELLWCKAVVIVEDTNILLPASFFGNPSSGIEELFCPHPSPGILPKLCLLSASPVLMEKRLPRILLKASTRRCR